MFSRYVSHFPKEYNPSDSQTKLLRSVEKAFNRGKKFVICCAPTGTGKSFLAKTVSGLGSLPTNKFQEAILSYSAFKQDFSGNYINEIDCISQPPVRDFCTYYNTFITRSIFKTVSGY